MKKWQEFINIIGQNRIKQTENAKLYIEVEKSDELVDIINQARVHKIPTFIIGAGSWPHIPNTRVDGLLIKNNCRRFDIYAMSGRIKVGAYSNTPVHDSHTPVQDSNTPVQINHKLVYAQSGTNMNQLVRFTIEEGLGGLEYHLGLPGTVGGAIFTNAKYAPEKIYVNDAVDTITILNKKGEIEQVPGDYFVPHPVSEFLPVGEVIISAVFRLTPEDKNLLWEKANKVTEYREKKNVV